LQTVPAELGAVQHNTFLFAAAPFGFHAELRYNVRGTVTFDTLAYNTLMNNLFTPVALEGFEFAGWYYDAQFTRPVLPTDRLTTNTTIYARFTEIPAPERNVWRWLGWVLGFGIPVLIVAVVIVLVKKKPKGKGGFRRK
jgi:uncharacterized repeat protein (TIGR02543 family)